MNKKPYYETFWFKAVTVGVAAPAYAAQKAKTAFEANSEKVVAAASGAAAGTLIATFAYLNRIEKKPIR